MRNNLPKATCPKCNKPCLAAELVAYAGECENCSNDPDVHLAWQIAPWSRSLGSLPNREGADVAAGAYKGRTARQLDTHTGS